MNSAVSQRAALRDFDAWLAAHPTVVSDIQQVIAEELADDGIAFDQVSVRIKDRGSYLRKLNDPGHPDYRDFESAHDVLGVRVTVFTNSEIPQLVSVMRSLFDVQSVTDKSAQTAAQGVFGYASRHVIARITGETLPSLQELDGRLIEVQLRTVLQHAWAEFEHDVRYKNPGHELTPEVHRAFTLAAGLIEVADQQFDEIVRQTNADGAGNEETELTATTLPGVLTMVVGSEYPMSKAEYYGFAVDMLAANGVTTIGELETLCSPEALDQLKDVMGFGYPPGQVRLIDDLLLFTYGRDHIRRTVHIGDNPASRPGRLGNRWQRMGQKLFNPRS
ncbi:MAG: GTP pyrophosphokinase [Mycobacteriaceae bacterium]|uniref:GTP pyrophosphokinase n=1 Tax=Corynebacterium sp. TaxID=1720 RepID=UPI003F9A334D